MTTTGDGIWVEKYRPNNLDDVAGHSVITDRLKMYVDDDEIPHMIFAGPPGTGKTTSAIAFAKEVYGDNWSSRFTEMNASDERGIDTIRDKVKRIARSNPAGGDTYQIIFLDEADHLTSDAQAALRSMMEQYSDITRFFLSCNYQSRIIEAIQSRCVELRFGRVDDDEVRDVLKKVADREGVSYEDNALEIIVRDARGDIRSAINSLQHSSIHGEVSMDTVETVIGAVDKELVSEIFDLSVEGNTDEAMHKLDMDLIKQGANSELLADVFLEVIKEKEIPAPGRRLIVDKLASTDWRTKQGANPNIQWHSFICAINGGYHVTHGSYDNE